MKHNVISNKRGFTLIELLAVITILAIIMLIAARSVTTVIRDAQKNAFDLDAQSVIETAKLAYTEELLNNTLGGNTKICFSVDNLKEHGLEKSATNFTGSVLVDVSGTTAVYTVWLSNGQLKIDGITKDNLTKENTNEDGTDASTTCGDATGVKFFGTTAP